ncbi:MAG TPA: oligosaccharide flippase family protein [Calditrichia bacterium]|nr:oligosaccharide flippase family protein [Calditrichia bacterium]
MSKKLAGNALSIATADVGGRFFTFIANIHIARVLMPENYGAVVIALSIMGYTQLFANLGLDTFGTREMARDSANRPRAFGGILQLKVLLGLAVMLAAQALLPLVSLEPGLVRLTRLYLLYLPVTALFLEWFFRGIRRYHPLTAARWLEGIFYAGLVFWWIRQPEDLLKTPLCLIAGHLMAVLFLQVYRARFSEVRLSILPPGEIFALLSQSIPIGLGNIFSQVVMLLPPIVIGLSMGQTPAGQFGAAFRLVMLAMVIDRVFVALFLPGLARKWAEAPDQVRVPLERALRMIILLGGGLCLTLSVAAPLLIPFLYGPQYQAAIPLLMILSWFLMPTLLNSVFGFGLIAIGREKHYFQAIIRGAALALGVILAASYGKSLTLAAWGVVLGEVIIAYSTFRTFRQFLNPGFAKWLLAVAWGGGLALAGWWTIDMLPTGSALLLPPVYLLGLLASGALSLADIKGLFS